MSFGLEGRWHTNLTPRPETGLGERRRLSLLSVTGGVTFGW